MNKGYVFLFFSFLLWFLGHAFHGAYFNVMMGSHFGALGFGNRVEYPRNGNGRHEKFDRNPF